jgi:hypothetical protein
LEALKVKRKVVGIAPNLMLVVGGDTPSRAGFRIGALELLFGEGSRMHGGDFCALIEQGLAIGLM